MWRKLFKSEKGQSVVEFALVLPLLILLLLGIMEGGRIFAGYLELQNAARDGVRYASVKAERQVESTVLDYVRTRINLLDSTKLGPNYSDGTKSFEFTVQVIGSGSNQERVVNLALKYPLEITTPIISDILTLTDNIFYLQTSMAMRSE